MTAKSRKVCHVITRLIIGGAQENTLLTCEGLHAAGDDVTLLSGPTTGPEGSLVDRARRGGYRYIEIPELVRAVRPYNDLRALQSLVRFFRSVRPDIVHTHSSKAGILARIAADHAAVPTIIHTIHGMSFNRTQPLSVRTAYAELERFCAARTHVLIAVADAMTREALAAGIGVPRQYRTIYSGMEVDAFNPDQVDRRAVRAQLDLPHDAVVVATIARLFRNKGYEFLIPAMALAARADPRIHFLWIGDGADRPAYEAALDRLHLRTRTRLAGLVPPGEIPRWLSAADMLAHASLWEGLPRAVVQALLMRIPAVAFSLDGAPEVVLPGRTGELVPPKDVDQLAAAILRLADDHERRRRYGSAGRDLCLVRFDHRRMVSEIRGLYAVLAPF